LLNGLIINKIKNKKIVREVNPILSFSFKKLSYSFSGNEFVTSNEYLPALPLST